MLGLRLQRARKAMGLSLRELASKVDLSQTMIKKYEDEVTSPSSETIIKLAQALNTKAEYFFRPETVELEGIEYRKKNALPQKRLNAITHEILDQIERRMELESLFPQGMIDEFNFETGLPNFKINHLDEIESVADHVRFTWELGKTPIPDLIDILEIHGIRVFIIGENADAKFDGLAAKVKGFPIIVVGKNWTGDRQRFTLAHELGHLLLSGRITKNINEESACNRFAGALLLPAEVIKKVLGLSRKSLELKELALLKEEFGISMLAILYRVRDLEIISESYHLTLKKIFSSNGWRIKEPGNPYPSEKAHIFEQQLFRALSLNFIGEAKAAELMNLSLINFRQLRELESDDVVNPL